MSGFIFQYTSKISKKVLKLDNIPILLLLNLWGEPQYSRLKAYLSQKSMRMQGGLYIQPFEQRWQLEVDGR